MTKGELVDQVRRLLSGGNIQDDFRWTEQEIGAAIGQARDVRVKYSMFENGKMTDLGYAMFPDLLKAYFLPVVCDSVRDRYYTDLTVKYVGGLPENKGLYQVSFVKSEQSAFKQAQPHFVGGYYGLDSYQEIGITYWPENGTRIWFQNWKQTYPQEVMVKIIPRVEDLDDTDELPMPADLIWPVIGDVLKMYGMEMPTDKVNDSANITT